MALSKGERREFRRMLTMLMALVGEGLLTRVELASLCGVSYSQLWRWSKGKSEPTPNAFLGIQARMPQIIAELKANQKKIDQILREIESLRGGGEN